MKLTKRILCLCAMLQLCITSLLAQTDEDEVKIDPRQYVTVHYRKTSTQGRVDTVWKWEDDRAIPNQKFQILDINGEIRIEFSRNGIIKNKDFEGTVSLEAEISGSNGTRKIEVNPYSEIGVQRVPIGIKSEPPSEIAKKLLNMIKEVRGADTIIRDLKSANQYANADQARLKTIKQPIAHIRKLLNSSNADSLRVMKNEFRDIESAYPYYKRINLDTASNDLAKRFIRERIEDIEAMAKKYNNASNETYRRAYLFCSRKVDIVLDYLSSFENGGEDATKAFLSLINKDVVSYKALKSSLIATQKKLSKIQLRDMEMDGEADTALLNNATAITEGCRSLGEIARFKGSTFEKILNQFAFEARIVRSSAGPDKVQDFEDNAFYYSIIDNHLQELSERLSLAAGRIIYKRLIYATIDLGKSGAKQGEVLNVYLTWILDSKRDSLANSPRLPIGKYYLQETGWKTAVADMFSLVKRIHEPTANSTNLSPSNFKGSGGAVLMWTYNKEDHGLNISREQNKTQVHRRNQFANFLQPSIGLNVSYLDFDTSKDVEIGTGLQLGLFSNKIFFGYGVNLNLISPAHQSPTYFFIGFSFAKLSELFKDSGSVTSNP